MPVNILETKRMNKARIARFISVQGSTSKAEIANKLNLSMPTTLQNVKELVEAGIVAEEGEYESTGGRKAKALSIVRDAGYAVGVDITNNHITMVIVNTRKEIIQSDRIRRTFQNSIQYYECLEQGIREFIMRTGTEKSKILGIGFSLPGIVDKAQKILIRSHTLNVENVSFRDLESSLGLPCELENDANSAACAELDDKITNAVYLSLSNTIGGAICLRGQLYKGENFRSGEFGHMVIERDGRTCYCGKRGCIDAYCSAKILQDYAGGSLEDFFEKVRRQDAEVQEVWNDYLDSLAIAVTNLRMAFDCSIVLGGYVGGYLEEFMPELAKRVLQDNKFDLDTSYLKTGKYKFEASAYGATLGVVDSFLDNV